VGTLDFSPETKEAGMDNTANIESPRYAGATSSFGSRSQGGSRLEEIKKTIADKLETAAHALRERTNRPGTQNEVAIQYGRQAATWLDSSAEYLRQMDIDRVKSDVQNKVRQNPGRSLLIAGAVGLVLGTLVHRR